MKSDEIGRKVGMLTVSGYGEAHRTKAGKTYMTFICVCDCGTSKTVLADSVRHGRTKSCGCMPNVGGLKHGYAPRKVRGGTYTSWAQMRSRCNNHNVPEYKWYGGRGIRVCERWSSFEAFLEDMGERPEGTSIERKDVNGDYCKSNCRWATRAEQARNTTRTRLVTFRGETKPLCDWIAELGLNKSTVGVRLHRGCTPAEALRP